MGEILKRYQYKHIRAEQDAQRKGTKQHFLAVNIVTEHHDAIDYYDYINVLMQAIVLKFDTPFLNEVLQLVSEVSCICCLVSYIVRCKLDIVILMLLMMVLRMLMIVNFDIPKRYRYMLLVVDLWFCFVWLE